MGLTRDEVAKVSLLARLRFSEYELETLTTQLGQVVEYVRQLEELDTQSVQPMAHVEDSHNVFADDPAFREMVGDPRFLDVTDRSITRAEGPR